jgi:putative ABC transport system permease protein
MARSTDEFGDSKSRPVGIVEAPPERQRGSGNRQPRNSRRAGRTLIPPTVTLAFWRLRKTWGLLLVTGIGIVAAVMLVCTVPLFSEIAMTAGLRGVLTSPSNNPSIYVYSASSRISAPVINQTTQSLDQDFQKNLGRYLALPQFSLQPPPFPILGKPAQSSKTSGGPLRPTGNLVELISASMDAAPSHVRLLAGRLPRTNSNAIEIAITPESAAQLQMTVGSVIPVNIAFVDANQVTTERMLNLHLVGLFRVDSTDDPFWDGSDFQYTSPEGNQVGDTIPALVSVETSLSVFTKISDEAAAQGQFFARGAAFALFWSYHLDVSHLAIGDLDAVLARVQQVQLDTSNNSALDNSPYVENSKTFLPTDILQRYHDRIAVAQLPVASLLLLMLGLALFFVTMMADLLVERQLGALAILRSRGASRRQVFGALMIQSIGLALIAFIAGPLLALVVARSLAQHTLSPADLGALNIIAGNPLLVALGLRWFALATAGVAILAMCIAILRSSRMDILAMRREVARSTRRPLWQRLNLDVVAGIILLVGFGFSLYLTNSNVLDPRLRLLLVSPLTLLESVFLVLALLLLFLRRLTSSACHRCISLSSRR